MRDDDDDHLRHLMPLLRRILILLAVLTAVPVVLWTITAFVRSYIGPPQVPTPRPAAAMASIAAPQSEAANDDRSARLATAAPAPSESLSAVIPAQATTTDAGGLPPAAKGRLVSDGTTGDEAKAPPSMPTVADVTPAAPADADAKAAASSAQPATPEGSAQTTAALAPQPPAAVEPAAEPAPAATSLTGPIPLPRRRPRHFEMAQLSATQIRGASMAIPMPRRRPDAAGPPASEPTTPGPFDWLQHIFQPHQ